MKRPRFGLKLIFLITALVAVCIAWRQAVERKVRADRQILAIPLQEKLERLEARRAAFVNALKKVGHPEMGQETLDSVDTDIKDLKDQINELTR